MVLLVTLPSIVGLIYQSFEEQKIAVNATYQQAIATVDITNNNQTLLIKETQLFLQKLSTFTEVLNSESPKCSAFLANMLKLQRYYINLGVPRVDGELLCNAKPLEKPINVADRPYIQRAYSSKDFSVGHFQIDRATGVTSINFAYPVFDQVSGDIIAFAVAVISLEWWNNYLAESNLPKDTVAYIIDSKQQIIATYPYNKHLVGENINSVSNILPNANALIDKPTTLKGNDNVNRLFIAKPMNDLSNRADTRIIVGIPINDKLAIINSRFITKGIILFFVVVLMFIVIFWGIKKSILTPLTVLLNSTKNLQSGKTIDIISPHGASELVDLQRQFIVMAKTRLQAEQELKDNQILLTESQNRLSIHLENTPLGCISWDNNFNCTAWNKSAERIFGYTEQEAIGRHVSALILTPDMVKKVNAIHSLLLKQQGNKLNINENLTKDGRTILCEWYTTPIICKNGTVTGIAALVQDITERKLLEEKLTQAAYVFSHALEGIIITDANGNIIDVNNTFIDITGYERDEVLGKNPNIIQSKRQSLEFYQQLWKSLADTGQWHGEIWDKRKNNQVFPAKLSISAVYNDSGEVKNYIAVFTDITDVKAHQHQLEHMAHYDVLTNLPNRTLLSDRLNQAIILNKRSKQPLAVVFLDLDGFKAINDAHGHDIGDELLITIANRIKRVLRDGDTLSRFGGDEFVAVLTNLDKGSEFEAILDRLLKAASKPITIRNILLKVSASIGATLYPQDDSDAEQLIRHADQAMYIAKQEGKNCYHLFDPESEGVFKDLQESRQQISIALKNGEFVLYYQPKVNMKTGEIIGVEALIRWQHPTQGILPPIDFLPLVENHPLSIEIGEWVLEEALTQIAKWQSLGLHLPVSVNIGAQQLQHSNFIDCLSKLLAKHSNIDPNYLELEVLETSALGDVLSASQIMNSCVDLGVSFAIDDFGTGYSSLTYLRRLPANLIKIDQTFIRDMLVDSDDWAIVTGVIALAKSFNRKVIAEGVETVAHGTALIELGCEFAQGYGIAKPMPAEQVLEWSATWQPDKDWQ